MTTTKSYDNLNRLTVIQSSAGVAPNFSFAYSYNDANQRVAVTNADSSQWIYQYDALGQVTSGKKYWFDGTPVAGQQFEYGFDDIGNRTSTKAGGDASGAGLRPASYSVNNLNQYTSRSVPGAVDILGAANSNATVTVNGQATYRKGEYFRNELSLDNSATAVYAGVTNLAALTTTNGTISVTNSGNVFLPQTPEAFAYDLDGNLTNDGRWVLSWDAENRLTSMVSLTNAPGGAKRKLDFAYDYRGRRTQKIVSIWNQSTLNYQPSTTNRFVYDGWNLMAILDSQSAILQLFVWGLDLSGTMHRAGGVGGLLTVNAAAAGVHFAASDGNGNVTALISANDGTVSARYQYGPFGEVIEATGLMAKSNPLRFSTKYQDDETSLLYYGYRSYNPNTGRWLSRDPIAERGGLSLYGFVGNDPVHRVDKLGLSVNDPPSLSFPVSFDPNYSATFVGKSFINGVPNLGDLDGREGLDITEGTQALGRLGVLLGAVGTITSDGAFANDRLWDLAHTGGLMDAFREDPTTDAKDGRYRLYSRVTIVVNCCQNKPVVRYLTDMQGGSEFGPVSGTINMTTSMKETSPTTVEVNWTTWGHPNSIVEPGMQWVAKRTSVNIWHDVTIKVSCKDAKPLFEIGNVGQSAFPSFRLWQDGIQKKEYLQGPLSALWNASSSNPTFVSP